MVNSNNRAWTHEDDAVDFVALGRVLWRRKLLVALVCGVCTLVALALALTTTPVYRAAVVVMPAAQDENTAGSSMVGQLGALTSLVGVNLTSAGSSEQEIDAVLDSRHLVEEFIKRNDLLSEMSRNSKGPFTLWLAVRRFKESVLTINKDTHKGATTVAVEWTDPVTAARWANGFVALANELIRARAIDDSSRNIAYLNQQIAQTNSVELRQAMYDIIKNETKTLMLANGRSEYAFEVVDPAVPPEIRERPRRTFMVMIGLAVGLVLGVIAAFLVERIQWHRISRSQPVSPAHPLTSDV